MELSDNHILFFYHLLLLPTAPFRLTIYNSSVHLLEKKKKKKEISCNQVNPPFPSRALSTN